MPVRLILASQSPRRRELLAKMGVTFEVIPSQFEEHLDDARTPEEVATELAFGKAQDIARRYPDAYVVGSDTIVTVNGQQLGKPRDADEAHHMLKLLSDNGEHLVTTGLVILRLSDNFKFVSSDTAKVIFKPHSLEKVSKYVASGDPFDKAGGYGLQSGAHILVDHIQGNYDTIIGLPTHLLAKALQKLGIKAQPVDIPSPVKQIL